MGESYVNAKSSDFQKGVDSEGKTKFYNFVFIFPWIPSVSQSYIFPWENGMLYFVKTKHWKTLIILNF